MSISVFELFSVGIGPSSSHTVGPMKAAYAFINSLHADLAKVDKIIVELYGSLALTGKGHGTDLAVLMGLEGHLPHLLDPDLVAPRLQAIKTERTLQLAGHKTIPFDYQHDLHWHRQLNLPLHPNGMRFLAFQSEDIIATETYYSTGGGFIVTAAEFGQESNDVRVPFPFKTAHDLWQHCQQQQLSIAEIMLANERVWRTEAAIQQQLRDLATVMKACIDKGCQTEGELPGGLKVKRRAPILYQKLLAQGLAPRANFPDTSLWPTVYAMAVNEENAAGGRIVTAPTNGAAGIIPAVLFFYLNFHADASEAKISEFLLTASAIALLYKTGASISGAEVGCQGEVGVACSMAAGALTAVMGGTLAQIENAAEMAMEHHLGLTCDPVAGLVQIPCIERNGVAAEKAIRIAYLALMEDGFNKRVSLDTVIATMLQTGKDMMSNYKETSLGGLAVNLAAC